MPPNLVDLQPSFAKTQRNARTGYTLELALAPDFVTPGVGAAKAVPKSLCVVLCIKGPHF
jgi:hypothetical protein